MKKILILLLVTTVFAQNYGLYFDGADDYVEIQTNGNFEAIIDEVTLSAWINLNEYPNEHGAIIAKRNFVGNPTGERHHFEFDVTQNGGLFFSTSNNENNELYSAQSQTSGNLLNLQQWHFVSISFNNGLIKFYVDGNLVHIEDFGYKEMFPNNHWINFARIHRSGGTPFFNEFSGLIAETSIFNRELSHQEIQDIMSTDINSEMLGLVGFWNFNSGNGDILYDISGNGANGTIYGAEWVENEVLGCTDELACNYNSDANTDDDSCDYSCNDNGDYSLSFDDWDDFVYIDYYDITSTPMTLSFDVSFDGVSSFIFRQYNGGHINLGYFNGPCCTGSEVLANTKNITLATWQGGLWDELVIYEDDVDGGFDDEWHNITAVYNPNGISKLYYDYVLITEGNIGSAQPAFVEAFNGWGNTDGLMKMKSAKIWHGIAISDNDIVNHNINQENQSELYSSISAHYKFNSGEGDILYDQSVNGNHGTVNGASWVTNETTKYVSIESNNESENGSQNHPFNSIQEAIDYSIDGDTILVSAGTYYENLYIDKYVTLIGENKENTFIDANQNGRVVEINSSDIGNIENLTIKNGFVNNDNNNKSGAGIYVIGDAGIYNFVNVNFINNVAKDEGGAGIFRGGRPHFINCNIDSNQAARGGGLFFTEGSLPFIDGCIFSNNNIVEWYHSDGVPFVGNGAGIAMVYGDYPFNEGEYAQIHNSEFINNTAKNGGGIYIYDSFININNCDLYKNYAENTGGAINVYQSEVNIVNSGIFENYSAYKTPGIWSEDATLNINKATFARNGTNVNYDNTGVLAIYNSNLHLKNSIIFHNDNDIMPVFSDNSILDITFSNMNAEYEGIGNISILPEFVLLGDSGIFDEDIGNYTLQSTSPCIDTGDPNSELDSDETRADMGAYYFHQTLGCTDELACNYNSDANTDDNSCDYSCLNNYVDINRAGHFMNDDFQGSFDEFSIEVIAKVDDFDPPAGTDYIIDIASSDSNVSPITNRIGIYVNDDAISGTLDYSNGTTFYHTNNNDWMKIRTSWKSSEYVKLFINDILVDEVVENVAERIELDENTLIKIGQRWDGGFDSGQRKFDGSVKSVKLFNSSLENDDYETSLINHWEFNIPNSYSEDIIGDNDLQNVGELDWYPFEDVVWHEVATGCTDELACNYNSDANTDDDSCDYLCHDNGDYSLYFDGSTGFNNPDTGSDGDGSTYIDFGNILQMNSSFTVGGWIKNDGMDYTTVMSKREWPNNYYGWHLSYETDGMMGLYIQENSSGPPTASVTTPQIFDQLFHIVAVFNAGNSLSLYIDGELVNTVSTELSNLSNNNAPFLISGLQDPGFWTWDGILDELFIYDGVLSDLEINDIYNSELYLNEHNVAGYWKFNAGTGDILYDHSGNQNHGTIYGAEWLENEVLGCTDESACNYDSDATVDDESCDYDSCSVFFAGYAALNVDVGNGIASGPFTDCLYDSSVDVYININTPQEACHVAFPFEGVDTSDWTVNDCSSLGQWDLYDCYVKDYTTQIIEFGSVTNQSIEMVYTSTQAIGGFQFSITGAEITEVSGGVADSYGFDVLLADNTIIGLSLEGGSIDPGSGVLTNLSYNFEDNAQICIDDLIVSDSEGLESLNFATGQCSACADTDNDSVCDELDSCPLDPENDIDNDGICGDIDPCPYDAENDADGDNICADEDVCPYDPENDVDEDDICGDVDACPYDVENDIDGDGICGDIDECPYDADNDVDNDEICDDVDDCVGEYDCYGTCNGDAVIDDCGVCNGENADKDCNDECFGGAVIDECDICDGNNFTNDESALIEGDDTDCAGVCNGDAEVDSCGVCNGGDADLDECGVCFGPGYWFDNNLNEDCVVNIQDVIILVNIVLYNASSDFNADINEDGSVNILDAVNLVSYIFGSVARLADATIATMLVTDQSLSLSANGYVGGIQMSIAHDSGFEIELTDQALVAEYYTSDNITNLIIIEPSDNLLFTTSLSYDIIDIMVVNSDQEIDVDISSEFSLSHAYPNPFNPSTAVSLTVPTVSHVSVKVYNLMGQVVGVLSEGLLEPNVYTFTWNAGDMSSGVYIIKAESSEGFDVQKVLLVK